ncbi:MAG: C25 family cysteine peptidase, partial [Planctomycetota bacterium]
MILAPLLALALLPGSAVEKRLAVLAPPEFRDPLEPLLSLRRAEGFGVEFVPLERGRASVGPETTHLLLVGDATRIPPGSFEDRRERVVSDETPLPEGRGGPAIGRLPARDREEVSRLVARLLRYERENPPGPWRARVLLTAGEGGFGWIADRAIEAGARLAVEASLPAGFELRLVRLSPGAAREAPALRRAFLSSLEPGALFWVYAGHGSPDSLASGLGRGVLPAPPSRTVRSLGLADAGAVRCGERAPVALLFACETARIEPGRVCLAEALLRGGEGPIAVLGAGGESHPYGDLAFALALGRRIRADREARLGDLVAAARRTLLVGAPEEPVLERGAAFFGIDEVERRRILRRTALQYLLLGDPTLRVKIPSPLPLDVRLEAGGILVRGRLDGEGAGFVRIEVERPAGP